MKLREPAPAEASRLCSPRETRRIDRLDTAPAAARGAFDGGRDGRPRPRRPAARATRRRARRAGRADGARRTIAASELSYDRLLAWNDRYGEGEPRARARHRDARRARRARVEHAARAPRHSLATLALLGSLAPLLLVVLEVARGTAPRLGSPPPALAAQPRENSYTSADRAAAAPEFHAARGARGARTSPTSPRSSTSTRASSPPSSATSRARSRTAVGFAAFVPACFVLWCMHDDEPRLGLRAAGRRAGLCGSSAAPPRRAHES